MKGGPKTGWRQGDFKDNSIVYFEWGSQFFGTKCEICDCKVIENWNLPEATWYDVVGDNGGILLKILVDC